MTHDELNGRRVALLLFLTDEPGDDQWLIVTGIVNWENGEWHFDGAPNVHFPLPDDTLDRIRMATAEFKKSEGADFYLPLTVGPLPDDVSMDKCIPTGLKVPDAEG